MLHIICNTLVEVEQSLSELCKGKRLFHKALPPGSYWANSVVLIKFIQLSFKHFLTKDLAESIFNVSRLSIYVGIYALIYLQTILGDGIVSRDGLPRGALPSDILKIEKYCPGLKVPVSDRIPCGCFHFLVENLRTMRVNRQPNLYK